MIFPVKEPYAISCDYYDPRPTKKDPDRKHAAIDICRIVTGHFAPLPIGTKIYAPEKGNAYYCNFHRDKPETYQDIRWKDNSLFACRNYFADWAGTFIYFVGEIYVHIFLHCEFDLIFNQVPEHFKCIKQKNHKGETFVNFHTLDKPVHVNEGDLIGFSGGEGKGDGPHIHLEIHEGLVYQKHADRPNPKEIYGI